MPEDEISFIRSPAKHGKEDYVFTIPREYLKKGLVDPSLKYKITIKVFRDERAHILKMIERLDEKLVFGEIDQETYQKLVRKYEEKLI